MANALVGEKLGEAVSGAAVFPWALASGKMDVARSELLIDPGIAQVSDVIRRVVEVEVVVEDSVHEILQVVDARHGEAALDNVGMFEKHIGGVIGAEGSAHGGDSNVGFAVVPNERNHFVAEVAIENGLHPAAVLGVRIFVVKAEAVDGVEGEEF